MGCYCLGAGKWVQHFLKVGWLMAVCPEAINIVEPNPSKWLLNLPEISLNKNLPDKAAVVVLAVKPQMMKVALKKILKFANTETIFLSIAAGSTIKMFEKELGQSSIIIRAMPNTAISVNKGITAIIGNKLTTEDDLVFLVGY